MGQEPVVEKVDIRATLIVVVLLLFLLSIMCNGLNIFRTLDSSNRFKPVLGMLQTIRTNGKTGTDTLWDRGRIDVHTLHPLRYVIDGPTDLAHARTAK